MKEKHVFPWREREIIIDKGIHNSLNKRFRRRKDKKGEGKRLKNLHPEKKKGMGIERGGEGTMDGGEYGLSLIHI